jgi:hypothetical protein
LEGRAAVFLARGRRSDDAKEIWGDTREEEEVEDDEDDEDDDG